MVNKNIYPLLTEKEQGMLHDCLHYMKMGELKQCCQLLSISASGNKGELIERIMHFIKTGRTSKPKIIPPASKAKNYPPQSLKKDALMLYGSYKNDTKTRSFFKKLVGPHFHFTAFGIDWLKDRWLHGNPPTYQEFADYWIEESARRKDKKAQPKKEWQYITFLQKMSTTNPDASKEDLMHAWKVLQAQKAQIGYQLLKKALKK